MGSGGVSIGPAAGFRPRFLTVGAGRGGAGSAVFLVRGFLVFSAGGLAFGGRPLFLGGAGVSAISSLFGDSDIRFTWGTF